MTIGIDASRAGLAHRTGTENYSFQLIKALARLDRENRYILYLREVPLYPLVHQANFVSKVLHAPFLWTQARLAAETLLDPPDVLFVPAHTLPIIRKPGLKTVVTIHDLGEEFLPGYHQFPQKYYLSFASRYAAAHASKVIAVSEATKSDLITRYGVAKERIEVVYEGVDRTVFKRSTDDEIAKIRTKYGLNRPYVFFVGTIQPRKNLTRLITAFAELVRAGVTGDAQLVIAGGRGWMDKEIYAAPVKEGIESSVLFIGRVPDEELPGLYSGAEVFAYPSLFEGFGLPVLEAFACGVAVLTSSTSSLPEVAGDAAILVDPENSNAIAGGLKELLTSKERRATYIKKGYQQLEKFSWEKAAEHTLRVLKMNVD